MEECEALCTSKFELKQLCLTLCDVLLEIGIMKLGQFVCLGNLQRLKNRFGNGYPLQDVAQFKEELMLTLPGVEIDGKISS